MARDYSDNNVSNNICLNVLSNIYRNTGTIMNKAINKIHEDLLEFLSNYPLSESELKYIKASLYQAFLKGRISAFDETLESVKNEGR